MAKIDELIENFEFTDATQMFECILNINSRVPGTEEFDNWLFRGHSKSSYKLMPSACRPRAIVSTPARILDNAGWVADPDYDQHTHVTYEFILLYAFYKQCHAHGLPVPFHSYISQRKEFEELEKDGIWISKKYWELAALAQHYGMPTRLMDWTFDGLTAAFFAIQGVEFDLLDGLASNTGNINIWCINQSLIERLRDKIDDSEFPFAIIDPPNVFNKNIVAQQGVLSIWMERFQKNKDVDKRELTEQFADYLSNKGYDLGGKKIFAKITLPYVRVEELTSLLYKLNYNEAKIYPGYEGVVKSLLHKHFQPLQSF